MKNLVSIDLGDVKGVLRYESLYGIMTPIIDSSSNVKTIMIPSYRDLKFFKLDSILPKDTVFLGFGKPNVYLAMCDAEGNYLKFDAKSLKRAPSRVVNTRGLAQSGLLFKFNNTTPSMRKRLMEASLLLSGSTSWTCVNANAIVLETAGFKLGGDKALSQFYFPIDLAREILRKGLFFDNDKVDISVIRTVPDYMENFGLSVKASQWMTACRHTQRRFTRKHKWIGSSINTIKKFLTSGVVRAKEHFKIEEVETYFPKERVNNAISHRMEVSYPSRFGVFFRWFWGPHSFFTVNPDDNRIDEYAPVKLVAYEEKEKSVVNFIKQKILFAPGVVKGMRKHLVKSNTAPAYISEKDMFNMLRTNTHIKPHKYNIVITGDGITIMKLGIKYKFVDWVLSKHILTSNYSGDVRFAGEVWKCRDGLIHINCNSGTYKPSQELLASVIQYLSVILPNIDFVAEELK